MSRLTEAGPDVCTACGCHCADAADCQVHVDLARDGVAREVFSNAAGGRLRAAGAGRNARALRGDRAAVRDRGRKQTGRQGR